MNVNAGIRRHTCDDTNIVDTDFDLMSYVLGDNESPPPSPPPPTRKSKRKRKHVRQNISFT